MFGRRKRQEIEELVLDARERLDANADQTAVLVEAITALNAMLGVDIARTERMEATADATTKALQHALSTQGADVSAALGHVASMYALLAERIEADRIERHTYTQVVGQLAQQLAAPAEPARPRVLGGSVFATPRLEGREINLEDGVVEVVADHAFDVGASVCCRFGDQWIDGVEIAEVVDDSGQRKYRLRRRQDGYVLPPSFSARDLRLAQMPAADTGTEPRGRWARS